MTAGKVADPGQLGALLLGQHEQIVDAYVQRLHDTQNPLVLDPVTRGQAVAQCISILSETVAAIGGLPAQDDQFDPRQSERIGVSRAAQRVHPVESLRASTALFEVVMAAGLECSQGFESPGQLMTDLALALNETLFLRIRGAATAYAGYLLDEVQQAHQHERRRVARELHDRVSATLGATIRQLELTELHGTADPERSREQLVAARASVTEAMDITRKISLSLRLDPPADPLGVALDAYLESIAQPDVEHHVLAHGEESWLPQAVRSEVYLVLREAARNAMKHSGARQVEVWIEIAPHQLTASVEDDGDGFTEAAAHGADGPGSGLQSMRERVALIGGSIRISPAGQRGTRVDLLVPLSRPRQVNG